MATIPASAIVQVLPSVLSAGGSALDLIGLILTSNTRVPIGTVQPFSTKLDVSDYFGASSQEAAIANVYFNGFDGSTKKPGSILYTQYPWVSVPAYLRSGSVTTMTLAQLQLLSGSLTIVVDGYTRTAASIVLSGATSFSSAAALIQAGLTATEPTAATVTGDIAPETASVTGSIAGSVLTVTAVGSGTLVPGAILTGTDVVSGTQITAQLSGTTGEEGTYAVSELQVVASTTISATYGLMTVSAVASGTLSVGQTISGVGVTLGTLITGLGTGTGLTGTYYVDLTQTVASETLTAKSTPITVTFDSVSGSFLVTSGITGPSSTIAYATGTLATPIKMTAATGAVISQGAAAATQSAFMNGVIAVTQNWATFMTSFDPDYGSGNTQKLAFAAWTDDQNGNYAYVCSDNDITPTQTVPATTSLGYLLSESDYSGTILLYEPSDLYFAPFVCGFVASIDFEATNGRATLAFKGQSGITAGVTNQTVGDNLIANGYNFYGAYATANQDFLFAYPGSVSGQFQWADSYVNQIWLNHALQLALMELLTNVNSIPYNSAGYALIEAACADPIRAGLNFGAFRAGVTLSSAQIAEVNSAAGAQIAQTLQAQGWYLQVRDASPQVRQARQSPPCNFWYVDGQSVQQIVLASINVQ